MIRNIITHGWGILCGLIFGLIISILIILFQKPAYEAQIIIAPTSRTGVPNLSSFLPHGVADAPVLQYFVGRIDAATSSDFAMFETLINSPRMASFLIDGKDNYPLPTDNLDDLTKWLKKHLKIRSVGMTPFRKITLRHDTPEKAENLLNFLYEQTDRLIRNDVKTKTQRRIAYLKEQLKTTHHPDHKDAIIALLKEQEQTAMTVSIDHAFAAEAIQSAMSSQKPASPDWRFVFPFCIFGGGIIGFMFSGLYRAFVSRE